MNQHNVHYDFVVVGAGVSGLTIANELMSRGHRKILVVEKEMDVGAHASGRNSGVLHAGIYYSSDSLKAKFCVEGRKRWVEFARNHGIGLLECGKVVVATRPETAVTLQGLQERGHQNGIRCKRISAAELKELEPEAHSFADALWSPDTAVIDVKGALQRLRANLLESGVEIRFGSRLIDVDPVARKLSLLSGDEISYGYLINAAGTYADEVAHMCNVGRQYRILPFKGMYWESSPEFAGRIRHLIYPAPDLNMPFLGLHLTKTLDGRILFGPTAMPALGRENYRSWHGIDLRESPSILWRLTQMLAKNPSNFRRYVGEEISRYRSKEFYLETKRLTPSLRRSDIGAFAKVGIRAQLMDTERKSLVMDFVVLNAPNSCHVLNAISPAFTCAPAFSKFIVDGIEAAN